MEAGDDGAGSGAEDVELGKDLSTCTEVGHLFEGSDSFRVFVCRGCGHVDFFVNPADLK